jgi:predicted transcriptional regulator
MSHCLTWQMNRLKENKLIAERKENKKFMYSIEYANALMLTEMAKLVHRA